MGAMVAAGERGIEGGLKSVLSALDVLDCFSHDHELGVCEIARRLDVAKSTAHRLLTTLATRGLIERNAESGRYRLGLRLYELGQLVLSRDRLRRAALPLLEELRQRTGWTVHLAVPGGADIVYLERIESLRVMSLFRDVGRRIPAHCTSSGKAIAAFNPEVAAARRQAGFPSLTDYSIRSPIEYERVLREVRRLGVAVNRDEVVVGLTSVGAPVRDHAGTARAAISVVGPTAEVTASLDRPARLMAAAARKLARGLAL